MSKRVDPVEVMRFLGTLYTLYDQLLDTYGVYKVGRGWSGGRGAGRDGVGGAGWLLGGACVWCVPCR